MAEDKLALESVALDVIWLADIVNVADDEMPEEDTLDDTEAVTSDDMSDAETDVPEESAALDATEASMMIQDVLESAAIEREATLEIVTVSTALDTTALEWIDRSSSNEMELIEAWIDILTEVTIDRDEAGFSEDEIKDAVSNNATLEVPRADAELSVSVETEDRLDADGNDLEKVELMCIPSEILSVRLELLRDGSRGPEDVIVLKVCEDVAGLDSPDAIAPDPLETTPLPEGSGIGTDELNDIDTALVAIDGRLLTVEELDPPAFEVVVESL